MEQSREQIATLGISKNKPIESPLSALGTNWGGPRPNSGRPKGSKNKRTRELAAVEKEFQGRVLKKVGRLFNAQMHKAEGVTMMFKLIRRKGKPDKHELVTDPDEICLVLDELKGMGGVIDDEYYFITTKEPDNAAIDSLLDRAGLVKQKTPKRDDSDPSKTVNLNLISQKARLILELNKPDESETA